MWITNLVLKTVESKYENKKIWNLRLIESKYENKKDMEFTFDSRPF